MTTATMTLDQINEARRELIRQAAISGKVDQANLDKLEARRQELEELSALTTEIDRERAIIEREGRQKQADEYLDTQITAMNAAADVCTEAAKAANRAIEAAQDAIQRWKDSGLRLQAASGQAHHAAMLAGRSIPQRSPGQADIHLKLVIGQGLHEKPINRIAMPYTSQPVR